MKSKSNVPLEQLVHGIRLLRVQNWFYLLGIAALAVARNKDAVTIRTAALILAFNAVYLCWGYVFNNYFDKQEDGAEKNSFVDSTGPTARFLTAFLSGLLIVLSTGLGLVYATIPVIALNAAYSVPPLRLKRFLVPSLIANGVFFSFVYFSASSVVRGELDARELSFCAFVFLLFLPLQYVHSLEHREAEGRTTGTLHRALTGVFLLLLCASPLMPALSGLRALFPATLVYCVVSFGAVLFHGAPKTLRRRIRWISAAFGLYLLAVFSLW